MHKKKKTYCLRKYGTENTSQLQFVKDKICHTTEQRYGVENFSKTEEFKNSVSQSVPQKYSVENVSQLQWVKNKTKLTNIKKYSVDSYFKSEFYKKKYISNSKWYKKLVGISYLKNLGLGKHVLKCETEFVHNSSTNRRLNNKIDICLFL